MSDFLDQAAGDLAALVASFNAGASRRWRTRRESAPRSLARIVGTGVNNAFANGDIHGQQARRINAQIRAALTAI